jgi:hypothetical protein
MSGDSRPSQILATRIGVALDLPDEFTEVLVLESAEGGRKHRYPDGHTTVGAVGSPPCPITKARSYEFMWEAVQRRSVFKAKRLYERAELYAIGVAPAMGGGVVYKGSSLDPWSEFKKVELPPLLVWRGPPKPWGRMSLDNLGEFISTIPPGAVVRCAHHERP